MVVSAANSAARKRSRQSSSAASGSRVPDQAADGMSEASGQESRAGAGGRAAKAREELAAVPAQDQQGNAAAGDELDGDVDLEGDVLEGDVDLADLEDLGDELGDDALGADDRTAPTRPTATPRATTARKSSSPRARLPSPARPPRSRPRPPTAPRRRRARRRARATTRPSSSATTRTTARARRSPSPVPPPTRSRTTSSRSARSPLLNAEQEVELAKRIEAGLFAEEKLNCGDQMNPQLRRTTWSGSPRTAAGPRTTCSRPTCGWWSRWPSATPAAACSSWT